MYKTETHMHVSDVSRCSRLTAAEMVERYHRAGYTTLMIADHLKKSHFERWGDMPWEQQVDWFLSGYENAKAAAQPLGMHVIFSAELELADSRNHYLLYGIDGEFLKNCPDILNWDMATFYPYAKERGVTIVQAHPYRDGVCFPTPEYVDGFEVHNSNPRHENFTDKAIETARQYGKPMTAGSDAHREEDVALTGVMTEQPIVTAEDYVTALSGGKLHIIREGDDR